MQHVTQWCEQVEQRVREEVRALRLDPMHDGAQVQSLIERLSAEVVIGSVGMRSGSVRRIRCGAVSAGRAAQRYAGSVRFSRSSMTTQSKRSGSMSPGGYSLLDRNERTDSGSAHCGRRCVTWWSECSDGPGAG